ncbi:hypothetical protein BGZ60DRAFT_525958 [Tricladium varicosporioides]|nr:hypothetical protein BGZ60DRAFT_525958 [Hymenoscyphus varicosporioides]
MAVNQNLFANNLQHLVENCLGHRDIEQIEEDVTKFYERHQDMAEVMPMEVMIRGAKVAIDETLYNNSDAVEGMTAAEEAALAEEAVLNDEHENTHNTADISSIQAFKRRLQAVLVGFRDFTWGLKVVLLTTGTAAIIQGWTQSSINTSGLGWSHEFGLDVNLDNPNLKRANTLYFGAINAAPFLVGSVLGLFLNSPLQWVFHGRRPALIIAGLISFASFIGSAYCTSPSQLLSCRIILGIGVAAKASIAPILAAEATEDRFRGRSLAVWQFMDTIGIWLGFCFNLATFGSWKATTAAPAIPTAVFILLAYLGPESPHFLLRKSDFVGALRNFRRLRNTDIQACRDFWRTHAQLQYETEMEQRRQALAVGGELEEEYHWPREELYQMQFNASSWGQQMVDLFKLPHSKRALVTAGIPMVAQILCGVNAIALYSSELFKDPHATGIYSIKAAWLGFGFGLANIVFTIPAFLYIDSKGRRFLLLPSLVGVTICLLGLAFCFQVSESHESLRTGLVTFFIILFTAFYSIGLGPIPFTLSAEVFPLGTRGVGMSFMVFLNFLLLGLLILFVPELTNSFGRGNSDDGRTNLLCFFAFLSAICFFLSFTYVRATSRPKLVEMAYIFGVPTRDHRRFQLIDMRRWLIRRWFFLDRSAEEPQFLTWAERNL